MRRIVLLLPILFTIPAFASEAGATLYRGKTCATCHGADGSGNTPAGKSLKARDLRSPEVQKQSDDELTAAIANGRGKMPAFKSSMTAEQIRDVVAHLRALAKP